MRIEQGFDIVSKLHVQRAHQRFTEAAQLSGEGKLDEAQKASQQGQNSLGKAVSVKSLFDEVAQEIHELEPTQDTQQTALEGSAVGVGRPLLEALVRSSTRLAVLSAIVSQPDQPIHLMALSRKAGIDPNSVTDEVKYLQEKGILETRIDNKNRLIEIKSSSKFYPLLSQLLPPDQVKEQAPQQKASAPPFSESSPVVGSHPEGSQPGIVYPEREEQFIRSSGTEVPYVTDVETTEEGRDPNDITPTEEKLLMTTMAVDEKRKGFRLTQWIEIYSEVFAEELVGLNEEEKKKLINRSLSTKGFRAKESLIRKLSRIKTVLDLPKFVAKAVLRLKAIPEYAHITNADIIAILEERMNFEDILQKYGTQESVPALPQEAVIVEASVAPTVQGADDISGDQTAVEAESAQGTQPLTAEAVDKEAESIDTLELSKGDTYLLAMILNNSDVRSRIELELHPEDKEEIERIIKRLGADPEIAGNPAIDATALIRKLTAYLEDRKGVFLANSANEDAQFLLTPIATLSTEEQIRAMIEPQGADDVKKNGTYPQLNQQPI